MAQHIKGAGQVRLVPGHLEAAELKSDSSARRQHPRRINLDSHHLHIGANLAQPAGPLHGGSETGAVADIHRQR